MPRASHLDAPGILHHVMGRGLDQQVIFQDDRTRCVSGHLTESGRLPAELATSARVISVSQNKQRSLVRSVWMRQTVENADSRMSPKNEALPIILTDAYSESATIGTIWKRTPLYA